MIQIIIDLWSTSATSRLLITSSSVLPDSRQATTASAQRMSFKMTKAIYPASSLLLKSLLTTQRALSVREPLAGLFLLMLCAAKLILELSAMTNSLSLRTLTNALSNSQQLTRLAVALPSPLDSSSSYAPGSAQLSWFLLVSLFGTMEVGWMIGWTLVSPFS